MEKLTNEEFARLWRNSYNGTIALRQCIDSVLAAWPAPPEDVDMLYREFDRGFKEGRENVLNDPRWLVSLNETERRIGHPIDVIAHRLVSLREPAKKTLEKRVEISHPNDNSVWRVLLDGVEKITFYPDGAEHAERYRRGLIEELKKRGAENDIDS